MVDGKIAKMLRAVARNRRVLVQDFRVQYARIPHLIEPVNFVSFVTDAPALPVLPTLAPRLQTRGGVMVSIVHHSQQVILRVREALLLLVQVNLEMTTYRGGGFHSSL